MEHSEKNKKLKEVCFYFNLLAKGTGPKTINSLKDFNSLVKNGEKEISDELEFALEVLNDIIEIMEKKKDPAWFISQKIASKEFIGVSNKLGLIHNHIALKDEIPLTDIESKALYLLPNDNLFSSKYTDKESIALCLLQMILLFIFRIERIHDNKKEMEIN